MKNLLPNPVQITNQNWEADNIPLVSIFSWVYNHKDYIRKSIDSILEQKTTFPVEIIIHDDASNDGTTDIIREYEKKYPNLFFNIIQVENQWSMGKSVMIPFFEKPRGKYVALTHGDDYWTDPYKLQKQVVFLEANPDYVMVGHDATIIDEAGVLMAESKLPEGCKRDASSFEMMSTFWVLTLSMCFRNVFKTLPNELFKAPNGDTFMISILGQYGKYKYMPEILPAAYRQHSGGVWSNIASSRKLINGRKTLGLLIKYYNRVSGDKQELITELIKRRNKKTRLLYWESFDKYENTIFLKAQYYYFLDFELYRKPNELWIFLKSFLKTFFSKNLVAKSATVGQAF